MKSIEKKIEACEEKLMQKIKAKNNPNPLIIYDMEKDEGGEQALKSFEKKYPGYDGAVFLLPEKEKLD